MNSSTWIGEFPAVSLPQAPPAMRESKPVAAARGMTAMHPAQAQETSAETCSIESTANPADANKALVSSVALLALMMRNR